MASFFEALSDDLLLHVLSFANAQTLARAGATSQAFRDRSRHESLWAAQCAQAGIVATILASTQNPQNLLPGRPDAQ